MMNNLTYTSCVSLLKLPKAKDSRSRSSKVRVFDKRMWVWLDLWCIRRSRFPCSNRYRHPQEHLSRWIYQLPSISYRPSRQRKRATRRRLKSIEIKKEKKLGHHTHEPMIYIHRMSINHRIKMSTDTPL